MADSFLDAGWRVQVQEMYVRRSTLVQNLESLSELKNS